MTKSEFLNEMRLSLTGRMDTASINSNISYYEDYINKEVRLGKTEEDVIADLGDANAIAISLIDAAKRAGANVSDYADNSYNNTSSQSGNSNSNSSNSDNAQKTPFWLKLVGFFIAHPVVTILIIIALIVIIIGLAIWLAISILTQLWPVILILLLAVLVGFLVYQLIKFINKPK